VATAAVQFKEGQYEAARVGFTTAAGLLGQQPDLTYNIALCHYKQGAWALALRGVRDIIERGVREHPELSVGSALEDGDVRSVGNSQALRETCMLEAFNLKAAVEMQLGNTDAAREALREMPPRSEEELDHVTLHNSALANMTTDPSGGFRKLQHLLRNPPRPAETLANLVLLYIKHRVMDLAADVLADYAAEASADPTLALSQDMFEYLSALVEGHGSDQAQAEAYRRLDTLAARHVETLRKRTKVIQEARISRSDEAIKAAVAAYDAALDQYIPVLMGQAKIYWDRGNYAMAERVFKQSAEFCSDHEAWKLNVAHVFFMQDDKFHDAIRYYEPYVRRHLEGGETDILNVTAIVLANLCVAYIMTSQNQDAAELMRQIDRAEERRALQNQGAQSYHLCIVNIVIGTLYCSKDNFEFGIDRVMKALEPQAKKLSPETWFHAKRCFLALAETVAKQMLVMKDSFFGDVMAFLDGCEAAGQNITAAIAGEEDGTSITAEAQLAAAAESALGSGARTTHRTVALEARMLKRMFIRLRDN
jgi:tetratricopeptide repeat protein 30